MKFLDLTQSTAAANLAVDEALLELCEAEAEAGRGGGAGVLRFYEPAQPGVVVGYGNRIDREVDVDACAAAGIPVVRRASGGGTVVLGPGCLASALVLPILAAPELAAVTTTNRWIMERHRDALASLISRPVEVKGHTDLVAADLKFSGNAQRRRRHMLLFHGTFLLGFDLALVERLLPMPSWQPTYRAGRPHTAFLTNLGLPAAAVKASLRSAWGADEPWTADLTGVVDRLMTERYGRPEWHTRS